MGLLISAARRQEDEPGVHLSAERQADLRGNSQWETRQLHVAGLRETDRVDVLHTRGRKEKRKKKH